MLNIIYGKVDADNYIFDPDTFFNNQFDEDWIVDDFSKKVIADIDNSEVQGPYSILSPVLGSISTERLSGGVKTLILINNDSDHIFNASACGDNCAKWLIDIGKRKDITIRLGYLMDFGDDNFDITIQNTGRIVHSTIELDDEVIGKRLLHEAE
jgi:hypothetical protein